MPVTERTKQFWTDLSDRGAQQAYLTALQWLEYLPIDDARAKMREKLGTLATRRAEYAAVVAKGKC